MAKTNLFSETESSALKFLAENGGSVLITSIPDKTSRDLVFGNTIPGIRVYQKLEKLGLLYITEEEPDETGFTFTPMVELTDEGTLVAKKELQLS